MSANDPADYVRTEIVWAENSMRLVFSWRHVVFRGGVGYKECPRLWLAAEEPLPLLSNQKPARLQTDGSWSFDLTTPLTASAS